MLPKKIKIHGKEFTIVAIHRHPPEGAPIMAVRAPLTPLESLRRSAEGARKRLPST